MSLITDKELCHSPRKLQKKQPPLNRSNTLKKQKVPVQSCCGELLTLEEESNNEGHLQRDCAHLVLVGHGCLPLSGEATSFICFQLFVYKEVMGWYLLAFGALHQPHCLSHMCPSHPFPCPLGESSIECGLSFGSGGKPQVLANPSIFWISNRTPLQAWESILKTGCC